MDSEKIKQIALSIVGENKLPDDFFVAISSAVKNVYGDRQLTDEEAQKVVSSVLSSFDIPKLETQEADIAEVKETAEEVAEEVKETEHPEATELGTSTKDENPEGTPDNPTPLPDEDPVADESQFKADETSEAQKTEEREEEAKEALREGETETETEEEEEEKNILLDQIQNPDTSETPSEQTPTEEPSATEAITEDENVLLSQIENLKSENERISLELSQKAQEELHNAQFEEYKQVLAPLQEVDAQYSLLLSIFDDLRFETTEAFEEFIAKIKVQVATILQELANKGLQMTPPGVGSGGNVNLLADQINAKTKELNRNNNN